MTMTSKADLSNLVKAEPKEDCLQNNAEDKHFEAFDMLVVKEEIEERDEELELPNATSNEEEGTSLGTVVKEETEEQDEEEDEDWCADREEKASGRSPSRRASKMEQRACIKFCVNLGKSVKETLAMLREAFGEDAMGRSQLFDWFSRFRAGDTCLEDRKRSGRPRVNAQHLPKVQRVIAGDPSLSFREIARITLLSYHAVYRFVEESKLHRVCGKLVPRSLTVAEKHERTNICVDLRTAANDDPTYISRIISCGESWFYGCHSVLKGKSHCMKCKCSQSGVPWPRKPEGKLPSRGLLIVFFDIKGIVHWEFSPCTEALSPEMYCEILSRLREAVRQKRPTVWKKSNWMLLHDNSPAHSHLKTRQFLASNNMTVVPHPQNSSAPDLIPWDFALMEGLKMRMKSRAIKLPSKFLAALEKDISSLKKGDFQEAFKEMQANWELCINSIGDYCSYEQK